MPPRHNIQRADHICHHCKRTFLTTGGVRRHIAHSVLCRQQRQTMQHAQCAPGGRGSDHEIEVGGMDLPNEGNDFNMGDVDFDPPGSHEDRAVELHKDGHMAVDGEEYFLRFAEEFLVHPTADVLGQATTPFKHMRQFQDASGSGMYAPFADCDEWELTQWLIKNMNL